MQDGLDRILSDRDDRGALRVQLDLSATDGDRLEIDLIEHVVETGRDAVDESLVGRILGRVRRGTRHGGDRQVHRSMTKLGDPGHRGHCVLHDLVGLRLTVGLDYVLAPGSYRRCSPDIGRRSHVGEIRGKRDKRSCAGRLRARGPDPDDRRDRGVLEGLVDGRHRASAAAQRVQLDHHRDRPVGLGLTNAPRNVARHDVVDDAAGRQDDHLRPRRSACHGRWPRRGLCRE